MGLDRSWKGVCLASMNEHLGIETEHEATLGKRAMNK